MNGRCAPGSRSLTRLGSLNIPLAPALHVRVGIASRLVVAGSAALDKTDGHKPVAISEAPHLAVQLEAIAQPDAVVIAASTRQGARSPALPLTLSVVCP